MSDSETTQFHKADGPTEDSVTPFESTAIVDRSSVGKLLVRGADRLDLLHRLSTNDLFSLEPFCSRGTVFTTNKGRIVDYARVLVLQDSLLLITSIGQEGQLKSWIDKYIIMEDCETTVVTSDWAMYSIVGPEATLKARELFEKTPETDRLLNLPFANANVLVDYQRDFSSNSVNVLAASDQTLNVWHEMLKRGIEIQLGRMSAEEYECFRIFHGIPQGGELTTDFNPYEVGLAHAISFTKGCYIGQEVIARLDTYKKVQRNLIRLKFEKALTDWHSRTLHSKKGDAVGVLSSFSPLRLNGHYLGLGIAQKERVVHGDVLSIGPHSNRIEGTVTAIFDRSPS